MFNEDNENCSRICCQSAVKNALMVKKSNPDTQVFVLYRDMRTYGLMEDYLTEAREKGVIFMRYDADTPPQVEASKDGLVVKTKDHVLQRDVEITAEQLVLSAGMRAADTQGLSGIMKLNANPEGYFIEAHVKLRPVDMPGEGIFLCGTAHGPKLISETISQAQAAASRATTFLARPEIKLSAIAATVDTDYCVKCLTCVRTCPFDVPVFNTDRLPTCYDDSVDFCAVDHFRPAPQRLINEITSRPLCAVRTPEETQVTICAAFVLVDEFIQFPGIVAQVQGAFQEPISGWAHQLVGQRFDRNLGPDLLHLLADVHAAPHPPGQVQQLEHLVDHRLAGAIRSVQVERVRIRVLGIAGLVHRSLTTEVQRLRGALAGEDDPEVVRRRGGAGDSPARGCC